MKRFSETLRWEEPWYRNLKPRYKSLYEYLWSRCDAAGVWVVDLNLAATFVGEKLDPKEALSGFSNKVVDLGNGTWLLPDFIKVQCGKLSPNSPPHKRVIECLSGHSLAQNEMNEAYPTNRLFNRLSNSLEEEEEEKEEEEDKKRKGESEGELNGHPNPEVLLTYLNEKAGRKFEKVSENLDYIRHRLDECGGDVDGCKLMIDRQVKLWNGTEQAEYLRPSTLFNSKKFRCYYDNRTIAVNGHRESRFELEQRKDGVEKQMQDLRRRHYSETQSMIGGEYHPPGWRNEQAHANYEKLKKQKEQLTERISKIE